VDGGIDLVEAGAGDGRLAADILDAATRRNPALYDRLRLHLVERSPAARAAQAGTLAEHAAKIASSSDALPGSFEGVLVANELLDALPVHQVVMREDGLREVYVAHPPLRTICGEPSTPRLAAYLDAAGAHLEPGWRAEIGLAAVDWMRDAARRLTRGFVVLVDYGHQARELYSARHSAGTLTTFAAHRADTADENAADAPWLDRPGEQDITAHVDFTSVTRAAESEGMTTIAFLDQTYFVLGLLPALADQVAASPRLRLALQTLVMPGGLGSTMKVLILGKGVGAPALRGCSYRVRAT
jgi:SAM-dependent MidA family methyltransferase